MDEQPSFGEISATDLQVGDIVEWSTWNEEIADWQPHYGLITEIKNEIKGARMVSVSIVTPLTTASAEMEFFTPSLKLISRGNEAKDQ
tara:strand:- start:754 stop:1017 length:264 start_codon:yes stop_codon:yes gene_type:complete